MFQINCNANSCMLSENIEAYSAAPYHNTTATHGVPLFRYLQLRVAVHSVSFRVRPDCIFFFFFFFQGTDLLGVLGACTCSQARERASELEIKTEEEYNIQVR